MLRTQKLVWKVFCNLENIEVVKLKPWWGKNALVLDTESEVILLCLVLSAKSKTYALCLPCSVKYRLHLYLYQIIS